MFKLSVVDKNKYPTFWRFFFIGRLRGGDVSKYQVLKPNLLFMIAGVALHRAPFFVELTILGIILFNLVFIISAVFSYFSTLEISDRDIIATLWGWEWFSMSKDSIESVRGSGWLTDAYIITKESGIIRHFVIYYSEIPSSLSSMLSEEVLECKKL